MEREDGAGEDDIGRTLVRRVFLHRLRYQVPHPSTQAYPALSCWCPSRPEYDLGPLEGVDGYSGRYCAIDAVKFFVLASSERDCGTCYEEQGEEDQRRAGTREEARESVEAIVDVPLGGRMESVPTCEEYVLLEPYASWKGESSLQSPSLD